MSKGLSFKALMTESSQIDPAFTVYDLQKIVSYDDENLTEAGREIKRRALAYIAEHDGLMA